MTDQYQTTQLIALLSKLVRIQEQQASALERIAHALEQQDEPIDTDEDSPVVDLAGRKIGGP